MAEKRPHFRQPPIVEQAITVSFEALPLNIADIGLFWSRIEPEFPGVETNERSETLVETFEGKPPPINVNFVEAMQLPRTLLRSPAGEVIQFQDDRFTYNWVRSEAGHEYPRFERTLARFYELFDAFRSYVQDRGYPDPVLFQCEMTNLNIVPVSTFGSDFADLYEAFLVPQVDLDIPGLEPETFARRRQHRIVSPDGEALGRLHMTLAPVLRNSDQGKAFQFELTARSGPNVTSRDEINAFFAIAHDMINAAFVASVTPRMRAFWGENDGQ